MNWASLRRLIRDFQLGLKDEIEVQETCFSNFWKFIEEDEYELILLYGKGKYALYFDHRRLKQNAIDLLSESNPRKDIIHFVKRLEEKDGIPVLNFLPRIMNEFALVEGMKK